MRLPLVFLVLFSSIIKEEHIVAVHKKDHHLMAQSEILTGVNKNIHMIE